MQILREKVEEEGVEVGKPLHNLCLAIRDLLLERVSADIERNSPAIAELAEKLRNDLTLYTMSKREPYRFVAGADAGSQILPLASRRYAVISALVYTLPAGSRHFLQPESMAFPYSDVPEMNGVVNVRREAKLFETALHFVKGNPDVELLLVDGPLAFSNWWSMAGREEDRRRLITAVNGLLNQCREEGVAVAGIVKRPSARYLVYDLGLQNQTDVPDSFLMLQTLKVGERTDIFSPRSAIRKAVRVSPFMDALESPIYSFYARTSKEWSMPPIRIDTPAFCLGELGEIADYCYGSSFWEGIPLPIVKADEEVKVSKRFISGIYGDIVGRVSRLSGEISHLAPYWGEGGWLGA